MKSVKVIGAGSIGNHLSNAARRLGWRVDLCDADPRALERARGQIYPGRYGQWDESIRLFTTEEVPTGGYDLICIGTPPESHIPLALRALEEQPKALLVEKPLCPPDLAGAEDLAERAEKQGIPVFVGYDHVVGRAAELFAELAAKTPDLGELLTLDVEFREHWSGIFAAHPWLDGPKDSYLGYWKRGGGSAGEHSHAVNLWQHFAHALGAGPVSWLTASYDFVKKEPLEYDRLALFHLRTQKGLLGRVVQDVVTRPPRKWARAQYDGGFIEWHCGWQPGVDLVLLKQGDQPVQEHRIEKTRPDDFIRELECLDQALSDGPEACRRSPLALRRGLDTMLVLAAGFESHRQQRAMRLDLDLGAVAKAISLAN